MTYREEAEIEVWKSYMSPYIGASDRECWCKTWNLTCT